MSHQTTSKNPASFRDPSGFVFTHNGTVFRQINPAYQKQYQHLISSGLYEKLVESNLLLPHEEVALDGYRTENPPWKIIKPRQIPFISYPYEWPFSMLKAAALLTLRIQQIALERGMILKDASAFNVQFTGSKPVFIDTLSFDIYEEGKPWVAYRQFVEHFLAPLYLIAKVDPGLVQLMWPLLDGIPVDTAARLLGVRALFDPGAAVHIRAHAVSKIRYASNAAGRFKSGNFSRRALLGLTDSLYRTVKKLHWSSGKTQWSHYYAEDQNNYTPTALKSKESIIRHMLQKLQPKTVWDMGANTGHFSRIAADGGAQTIAFDNDWGAVEKHYQAILRTKEDHILPLFCDLANPTPMLGWMNQERLSLQQRGPSDTVMALALLHHLAIGRNVPLSHIARCFASIGKSLIMEFVDKDDSQVKKLLGHRKDIFIDYSHNHFKEAFAVHFDILQTASIEGSRRTLYLMRKK